MNITPEPAGTMRAARILRHSLFQSPFRWWPDLGVQAAFLVWIYGGSRWNGQTITIWGRVLPSLPVGRSEAATATVMMHDALSALALYLLLAVAFRVSLPLACSFSLNQTLWLRTTGISPRSLALSRAWHMLSQTTWLAAMSAPALVLVSLRHGLDWRSLSGLLTGVAAAGLFGSCWALGVGWFLRGSREAVPVALAGLLLPAASFVMFDSVLFYQGARWARWYPTYLPFVRELAWTNSVTLLAAGALPLAAGAAFLLSRKGS